ncbi:hypothetical protein COOONC_12839 [Cooperia oncophora]
MSLLLPEGFRKTDPSPASHGSYEKMLSMLAVTSLEHHPRALDVRIPLWRMNGLMNELPAAEQWDEAMEEKMEENEQHHRLSSVDTFGPVDRERKYS